MYEISFNIFELLYLTLIIYFFPKYKSKYYLSNQSNNKNKYKKQIYFECGGGYVNYYGGIIQFIKENYSDEVLDKIIWIGSSAGSYPAIIGAFIEVENNESKEILIKLQKKMEKLWFGAIYKLNIIIKENFYEKYLLDYEEKICNSDKLFIMVLNINIICPIFSSITFYYNFENMKEFTDSCLTSHGIPFITGPLNVTILSHPSKWYIKRMDAGFFSLLFGFLFGYDKFMPYGNNVEFHIISPTIFRNFKLNWSWLWCSIDHTEMLFNLGYEDAKKNVDILNKMIL